MLPVYHLAREKDSPQIAMSKIGRKLAPGLVICKAAKNNPFTTTVNVTLKDRYSRLKAVEFSARPCFYFYAKFNIQDGHNHLALRCRNFSGNATYVKLAAIDDNMNVKYIQPSATSTAASWGNADHGCFWFVHENGGSGSPESYALFDFDLSQFNGKDVTLVLGVF